MKKLLLILSCLFLLAADSVTVICSSPDRPVQLVQQHFLPDLKLTPGAYFKGITGEQATKKGYPTSVRNVPESVKKQVFKSYGVVPKSGEYEIDHLISLELGGSNDIHNLWPQSYLSKPWNAHIKDRLEDHLAALVRQKQITLLQAQEEIRGDWTSAYVKYFGPIK